LTAIRSFKGRVQYCQQHLGKPIGRGSSRVVFQIDDDKVLKLALNNKGIAQNELEGREDYVKDSYDIFPNVFQMSDDCTWLISEFVLPAKKDDFQHCIGLSFDDWAKFIKRLQSWYSYKSVRGQMDEKEAENLICNNEIASDFNEYVSNYNDILFGDLLFIQNYGLAMRNGQPYIVLLDSGCNSEIYGTYYSR
jgi:hypothetical protein